MDKRYGPEAAKVVEEGVDVGLSVQELTHIQKGLAKELVLTSAKEIVLDQVKETK